MLSIHGTSFCELAIVKCLKETHFNIHTLLIYTSVFSRLKDIHYPTQF